MDKVKNVTALVIKLMSVLEYLNANKIKIGVALVLAVGLGYKAYKEKQTTDLGKKAEQIEAATKEERRLEATKNWPTTKKFYLSCSRLMKSMYEGMVRVGSSKTEIDRVFKDLYEASLRCDSALKSAQYNSRTTEETKVIAHNIRSVFSTFYDDTRASSIYEDRFEKNGTRINSVRIQVQPDTVLVAELIMDFITRLNETTVILDSIFTKENK